MQAGIARPGWARSGFVMLGAFYVMLGRVKLVSASTVCYQQNLKDHCQCDTSISMVL